jgi:glycosyltransferase involved in cell wall biosynthesis
MPLSPAIDRRRRDGSNRPIRVAHVVATTGTTGAESYLTALLPSFDPLRVAPVLFVPGPGVLVDRLRALGVPVERGAPTRKLAFLEERAFARRLEGAFDIVHAHGARASFWAERAAHRAGIDPFVVTLHELRWQTLPPGWKRELWTRLEIPVLRSARRILTVSAATRRDLIERVPDVAERTSVVHASAPLLLEADRLPAASPGAQADAFRLVNVGRFNWQKGYDLLIEAMGALERRGVNFTLDIVGFGVQEGELRAQAARLGLEHRIRWHGPGADVPAMLAAAHVFVTATRAEMFGIAVLEAMAIGLPVLAPAVGSLTEVVEDGATGSLVPFEPEATLPSRLAAVLADWARDPELRARLGAAGAARARAVFSPPALAAGITREYESLLAEAPRRGAEGLARAD